MYSGFLSVQVVAYWDGFLGAEGGGGHYSQISELTIGQLQIYELGRVLSTPESERKQAR